MFGGSIIRIRTSYFITMIITYMFSTHEIKIQKWLKNIHKYQHALHYAMIFPIHMAKKYCALRQ